MKILRPLILIKIRCWAPQFALFGVSECVGMCIALYLAHGRVTTAMYNIQSAVERETCASALWLWWAAGPPAAAFWIKTSIYLSHLHVFVSCLPKSKDSRTLFVGVEEKWKYCNLICKSQRNCELLFQNSIFVLHAYWNWLCDPDRVHAASIASSALQLKEERLTY